MISRCRLLQSPSWKSLSIHRQNKQKQFITQQLIPYSSPWFTILCHCKIRLYSRSMPRSRASFLKYSPSSIKLTNAWRMWERWSDRILLWIATVTDIRFSLKTLMFINNSWSIKERNCARCLSKTWYSGQRKCRSLQEWKTIYTNTYRI